METKEILIKARDLLIERGWAQGHCALDVHDKPIPVDYEGAVRFCSGGAIFRVAGECFTGNAMDALERVIGDESIPKWNDAPERTKEEVIEAFNKAIESV